METKKEATKNDETKNITKMFLNWICYCKKSSQLDLDKPRGFHEKRKYLLDICSTTTYTNFKHLLEDKIFRSS